MLKKEESYGHIKGVAVCRGAPRISHLLFVDDSIVFCRASLEEVSRVMKVIQGKDLKRRKLPYSLARIQVEKSKTK